MDLARAAWRQAAMASLAVLDLVASLVRHSLAAWLAPHRGLAAWVLAQGARSQAKSAAPSAALGPLMELEWEALWVAAA